MRYSRRAGRVSVQGHAREPGDAWIEPAANCMETGILCELDCESLLAPRYLCGKGRGFLIVRFVDEK